MGSSDWQAAQAEREKNSRLCGGKPPRRLVWRCDSATQWWEQRHVDWSSLVDVSLPQPTRTARSNWKFVGIHASRAAERSKFSPP